MTERNVFAHNTPVNQIRAAQAVLRIVEALPVDETDPRELALAAKARLEAAAQKRIDLMKDEALAQGLRSHEDPMFRRTLDTWTEDSTHPVTIARQEVWEAYGEYLRYAAWLPEPTQD